MKHPLGHYLRKEWVRNYLKSKSELIASELRWWWMSFLMYIPGRIGSRIRVVGYGFKRYGKNVFVSELARIKYPERVSLGDHVRINIMAYMDASGGIQIGSHVGIGPGAQIYSINHQYQEWGLPYQLQGYEFGEVIIEDDVWVGAGAIILAGVKVGRGTVIAAGAVVTKSTEPHSVVAGIPARLIKKRAQHEARTTV